MSYTIRSGRGLMLAVRALADFIGQATVFGGVWESDGGVHSHDKSIPTLDKNPYRLVSYQ